MANHVIAQVNTIACIIDIYIYEFMDISIFFENRE